MPGTYRYFLTHSPAVPGCFVNISWGNKSKSVSAIIDTGADHTFIPSHLIKELNLRRLLDKKDVNVSAPFRIGKDQQGFYVADLQFLGITIRNHPVLILNWPEILIGREIINRYLITLDGINKELTIL